MASATTVALPSKKRLSQDRRVIVGDIENIVGGAVLCLADAQDARAYIAEAIGLKDDDQVILGTCHLGMQHVCFGWPGVQYRVQSGPDGADLILIEAMRDERIGLRFDELILVSGDGIFTDEVVRLTGLGVKVTVVAREGSLSKRLAMAAHTVITLDPHQAYLGDTA